MCFMCFYKLLFTNNIIFYLMKKKKCLKLIQAQGVVLVVAVAVMAVGCGSLSKSGSAADRRIKLEKTKGDPPHTSSSLRAFMKDGEGNRKTGIPVVVRNNRSNAAAASVTSTEENVDDIIKLLENGLMRNDFNVKDRIGFENVMSKTEGDVDYEMLQKKTKTDLVFEITDYGTKKYTVKNYLNDGVPVPFQKEVIDKSNKNPKKWKKEIVPDPQTIVGLYIEIKVILMAQNEIGGIYKYYHTPCSDKDCRILTLDPFKYLPDESDKVEQVWFENGAKAAWSEFINTVAIPQLMEEMSQKNKTTN
ncbi:hypothetical protein AGMMS49982_20030 [Bacteroidia bacterium]|nr:hypothetical protein AGMMS49982_20030 [Bacteroidia bacterium]